MKKLRLGLLGTGIAAEKLYLPAFRELGERIELVACANRTRKKAERYARLAGVGRVVADANELLALPEVEAVLVSLPIAVQPEYVLAALQANKAVLSEKPVGPSVAAARRLIRAAARYETPWLVGENFAFMSHVRKLAELVARGELGEVRVVEARQMTFTDAENPYFHTGWRAEPEHVGGFVVDAGVHLAHVVRRCFGTPRILKTQSASFEPTLPPLDTAVALLKFESGALGTWTSAFSTHYAGPMLRVFGARATADLHYDELVVRDRRGRERRYAQKESSFRAEFAHFADVVQKGVPLDVTPGDALADLALMEALAEAPARPHPKRTGGFKRVSSRSRPSKRAAT
jgi:predicted dehydrogenase